MGLTIPNCQHYEVLSTNQMLTRKFVEIGKGLEVISPIGYEM